MGDTLSLIEKGIRIVESLVNMGIKVYNCIEEKIIKRKERSKQNEEDKDQNKFQRDRRKEREIMNNYQRRNWNQQYNKMYDGRLKDYRGYDDDVNFDYY